MKPTADAVSVGLVGAGYWGQKLLPKFLADPTCSVRSVCDIHCGHRENIHKNFPNLVTTDSYEEILDDSEIAAVVLATPPATHFQLAKEAVEAGKHIWIEKPLALHLDEGHTLVKLAQEKKTVLFVDHTFLYDPAIRMLHDLIAAGDLGDVHHLFLQRTNLGRIKRDSNVWWNSAPHDISIMLYLLPVPPTSIILHGYRYLQPELEDLNFAVVEMSDGVTVFIYHNWLYPENTAKLVAVGSKHLLLYEGKFEKRAATLYDYVVERLSPCGNPNEELSTTIPARILVTQKLGGIDSQEPLVLAISDFLHSVQNRQAPLSDGNFALRVLEVLEAGEKSLRSGGIKIPVKNPQGTP
jgi:predicted dehydrogenase